MSYVIVAFLLWLLAVSVAKSPRRTLPAARSSWPQVAERLGLAYSETQAPEQHPRLRGRLDGVDTSVQLVWTGVNETRRRETLIESPCALRLPAELAVRSRGGFLQRSIRSYVNFLMPTGVPAGTLQDPKLDQRFSVECGQVEVARELTSRPRVRAALLAAGAVGGSLFVGGGRPRVTIQFSRIVTKPEVIERAIRAATELACALDAPSTAAEPRSNEEFSWRWHENQRRNVFLAIAFLVQYGGLWPVVSLLWPDRVEPLARVGLAIGVVAGLAGTFWLGWAMTKNGELRMTPYELSFRFGRRRKSLALRGASAELRLGRNSFQRELHLRAGDELLFIAGDSDSHVSLPSLRPSLEPDCELGDYAFAEIERRLQRLGVLNPQSTSA